MCITGGCKSINTYCKEIFYVSAVLKHYSSDQTERREYSVWGPGCDFTSNQFKEAFLAPV